MSVIPSIQFTLKALYTRWRLKHISILWKCIRKLSPIESLRNIQCERFCCLMSLLPAVCSFFCVSQPLFNAQVCSWSLIFTDVTRLSLADQNLRLPAKHPSFDTVPPIQNWHNWPLFCVFVTPFFDLFLFLFVELLMLLLFYTVARCSTAWDTFYVWAHSP